MSATIQKERGPIWQFRISGVLKKAELDSAQDLISEDIDKIGAIRVLLVLEGFQGWEKGPDWGDMTFFANHADDVEKIAVVADAKWEGEVLMFIGAGLRRTRVEFFVPEEAGLARTWLEEDDE